MDELEALHRQLKESAEDGDFISPEKAREMLRLLEVAMEGGFAYMPHDDEDGEMLHSSEEVAHEVSMLCDASSEFVPQAFSGLLRSLSREDISRLRDAVREVSDTVDWIRLFSGPAVAPDVVFSFPGAVKGVVYWIRLRQVSRILEGKDDV